MENIQGKPVNIYDTLANHFECDVNVRDISEKEAICEFIRAPIELKISYVKPLIQKLMEPHSKEILVIHIDELYKIEKSTNKFTGKRDHVIHAVNTYLLGRYINDMCRDIEVDPFEWKLAALFHDIGYPMEIAAFCDSLATPSSQQIIKKYFEIMNENGVFKILDSTDINSTLISFETLTNEKNALDYIQEKINIWDESINVREKYESMIDTDKICHGMISALTVLHWINSMYLKNNPEQSEEYTQAINSDWNQKYFKKNILFACSAIFIHNLDDNTFDKIYKKNAPLPYLLKLCDELQNWDRPKGNGDKHGEDGDRPGKDWDGKSSEDYGISIEDGKLIFYVKDKTIMEDIRKNIECLNDKLINVCLLDNMPLDKY